MAVALPFAAQLFRRVIEPDAGTLAPELARYVRSLDFPPADHARYEALSSNAQDGPLTANEADELDGFLHVDSLIGLLRLKAERSLGAGV